VSAILFDLDGTLTDPREGITRSIAHALQRMGREAPPLDALTFAIGPPLRGTFAQLLDTDRRETIEQAVSYYRERFADVGLFENAVYDGIADTLEALALGGAKLIVCTSKPVVYARRIVDHFGLGRHFLEVHGCELDGTREDKRDLIAHIVPHHGLQADLAVMIGDRGVDMRAARHHGLTGIGALWGYGSHAELEEHGAHRLCRAPQDLLEALEALRTNLTALAPPQH
jgi:phosphoglycolate phosphatase